MLLCHWDARCVGTGSACSAGQCAAVHGLPAPAPQAPPSLCIRLLPSLCCMHPPSPCSPLPAGAAALQAYLLPLRLLRPDAGAPPTPFHSLGGCPCLRTAATCLAMPCAIFCSSSSLPCIQPHPSGVFHPAPQVWPFRPSHTPHTLAHPPTTGQHRGVSDQSAAAPGDVDNRQALGRRQEGGNWRRGGVRGLDGGRGG